MGRRRARILGGQWSDLGLHLQRAGTPRAVELLEWAGSNQHLFDPAGNWLGEYGQFSLVRFGSRHIAVYSSSETYLHHINSIGSTSLMTGHTGTSQEDMLFYPWGQVASTAGGGGYNFGYLPYRDVTTNIDLTMARLYASNFGRWFSPDPLGKGATKLDDPQTWKMYAYVRNNPLTLTDPSGLCADHYKDGTCKVNVDPSTGKAGAKAGKQLEDVLNKNDKALTL